MPRIIETNETPAEQVAEIQRMLDRNEIRSLAIITFNRDGSLHVFTNGCSDAELSLMLRAALDGHTSAAKLHSSTGGNA